MIARPRCHASVPSAVASALVLFACASIGTAQALPVEFEQRFDQIVLTTAQGGVAVRVFPLGLAWMRSPIERNRYASACWTTPIVSTTWPGATSSASSFSKMCCWREVRKATKAGKYEDAYRLLAFVWKTDPNGVG